MSVVVVLLHVNCFAQYALCGLNLGYERPERPIVGVGICLSMAIAAPAVAGVYAIFSPLGKEYEEAKNDHINSKGCRWCRCFSLFVILYLFISCSALILQLAKIQFCHLEF